MSFLVNISEYKTGYLEPPWRLVISRLQETKSQEPFFVVGPCPAVPTSASTPPRRKLMCAHAPSLVTPLNPAPGMFIMFLPHNTGRSSFQLGMLCG